MKIIKATPKPGGKFRLIVEVEADESLYAVTAGQQFAVAQPGEKLLTINPDAHYTLGEPMREDVIAGHILAEAKATHWCSIEQKWR